MNRERYAALFVVAPMVMIVIAIVLYSGAPPGSPDHSGKVVIDLTGVAASGVWTLDKVNGLNYWWKDFEPATIFLQEGDHAVINLRSADLFHSFYVPAFSVGPVDVRPGHMVTVVFEATRSGVFQYYCTSMCGGCHFFMRGWIVVTAPGQEPVTPPPIICSLCRPGAAPPPVGGDMLDVGAYLYLDKGCVTCHGLEAGGGVANDNSASVTVPAHNTTAQKLFLDSEEDAEAFIQLVSATEDLDKLEETPSISRFNVVHTRFDNAKEIIRGGRYTGKLDSAGPEPPLQMPAWEYLLDEREMDALLMYFVSLYPWEEEES